MLRGGSNALGVAPGNGMYHVEREGRFTKFIGSFGEQRLIAHLRLEYDDGSVEVVGTDGTWRTHPGAITYSNIYGGEDFDARRLPKRYFAYLESRTEDGILSEGLGDWHDRGPRHISRAELTMPPLTATAFFNRR